MGSGLSSRRAAVGRLLCAVASVCVKLLCGKLLCMLAGTKCRRAGGAICAQVEVEAEVEGTESLKASCVPR